jgi:hypothetical protein
MSGWWFDRAHNLFDKMPYDIPGRGWSHGGDCLRCPCVDGANPSFFVELFQYSRQYKQVEEHAPGVGMANSRLKGQFPSNSYGVVVFRGLKLRLEGRLLGAMRTLHLSTSLTIVLCFSRLWVNLVYSFELTDYRFKKVENWARLSLVCRVTCSCAHPGSSSVGVFILLS